MNRASVAVLGTGTMGAAMARNLLRAGFEVRVWNRTPERAEPLAADGATVAAGPGEAVEGAGFVLTMLADGRSVEETLDGAWDAIGDDAVWIQSTTVGVAAAERFAALADACGIGYVDAPVLGTKRPAELGELVVLASGPDDLLRRADPVFAAVGSSTIHVGEAGAGSRLKIVVNLWALAVTEAVAEAIALAEGLDLDPRLFLKAMKGGPLDARYLHLKGEAILDRRLDASFSLELALKDAGLICEAADSVGVDAALARAVQAQMACAADLGHGGQDMAATYFAATRAR